MFADEHEVRIVLVHDYDEPEHPDRKTVGAFFDWDPELHVENIWVHPEAQFWFMDTVTETVRRLAPKLCPNDFPRVWYSKMNTPPPF